MKKRFWEMIQDLGFWLHGGIHNRRFELINKFGYTIECWGIEHSGWRPKYNERS